MLQHGSMESSHGKRRVQSWYSFEAEKKWVTSGDGFLQRFLFVDHSSFKHLAYIVWAPGANVDVTVSEQKGVKVTSTCTS